jgi:hypothetical protein
MVWWLAGLTAIRPDEIPLSSVSLAKDYSSWQLKGTVTNNSKFNLGSIKFLVTVQDCPASQVCKIIGQETIDTMSEDYPPKPLVPPGQVRLFKTYAMKFVNMPLASNFQWDYKITEIRAAF